MLENNPFFACYFDKYLTIITSSYLKITSCRWLKENNRLLFSVTAIDDQGHNSLSSASHMYYMIQTQYWHAPKLAWHLYIQNIVHTYLWTLWCSLWDRMFLQELCFLCFGIFNFITTRLLQNFYKISNDSWKKFFFSLKFSSPFEFYHFWHI